MQLRPPHVIDVAGGLNLICITGGSTDHLAMPDGIAVAVADAHGIDPVGQSREWVGECLPGECHSRHLRARHVIDADAIVPSAAISTCSTPSAA